MNLKFVNNVLWYTEKDVENEKNDDLVLAMGLTMWGHCFAGNTPPESFGMTMVKIGQRLGVSPTSESLSQLFKDKGYSIK